MASTAFRLDAFSTALKREIDIQIVLCYYRLQRYMQFSMNAFIR